MQVYLAAIAGHVPSEVVKCLSAFLDFCQIARRNAITSNALDQLQDALDRFHSYRGFFIGTAGVNGDFILLKSDRVYPQFCIGQGTLFVIYLTGSTYKESD